MLWFINEVCEPYRYCYFKYYIKGANYCCISLISKNELIKIIQNANLNEKAEHYKT